MDGDALILGEANRSSNTTALRKDASGSGSAFLAENEV